MDRLFRQRLLRPPARTQPGGGGVEARELWAERPRPIIKLHPMFLKNPKGSALHFGRTGVGVLKPRITVFRPFLFICIDPEQDPVLATQCRQLSRPPNAGVFLKLSLTPCRSTYCFEQLVLFQRGSPFPRAPLASTARRRGSQAARSSFVRGGNNKSGSLLMPSAM